MSKRAKKTPYVPEPVNSIFDGILSKSPIYIQCAWVKAYLEPVYDKGLCLRSYDRVILGGNNPIGTATGNYFIDSNKVTWIETGLILCDRSPIGWVRKSDVFIKKNSGWLVWLTAGLGLLSSIK